MLKAIGEAMKQELVRRATSARLADGYRAIEARMAPLWPKREAIARAHALVDEAQSGPLDGRATAAKHACAIIDRAGLLREHALAWEDRGEKHRRQLEIARRLVKLAVGSSNEHESCAAALKACAVIAKHGQLAHDAMLVAAWQRAAVG